MNDERYIKLVLKNEQGGLSHLEAEELIDHIEQLRNRLAAAEAVCRTMKAYDGTGQVWRMIDSKIADALDHWAEQEEGECD